MHFTTYPKQYRGYLIVLDVTMSRGYELSEVAGGVVDVSNDKAIRYFFFMIISPRTPATVSEKLNQMNIKSTPEHVFTASLATAKYIKHKQANARCFVVGEEGLLEALGGEGLTVSDENCDYVVVGLDRAITYEKLAKA